MVLSRRSLCVFESGDLSFVEYALEDLIFWGGVFVMMLAFAKLLRSVSVRVSRWIFLVCVRKRCVSVFGSFGLVSIVVFLGLVLGILFIR